VVIRRALPLLAAAAALAGCEPEFQPRSSLRDLRVLALVASPLEVGPGEEVAITPYAVAPAGAAIAAQAWSFCPFSAGSAAGFACAVPECEIALPAGPDGGVRADPLALAQACLAGPGGAPAGLPATLPERVELLFRYAVTSTDGDAREALARVPFYPRGAPAARNAPPVVLGVELGGAPVAAGVLGPPLRAGGALEVRVRLDPASAETYRDASGRLVQEALVVSFYATAGEWDADRADGPDARRTLEGSDLGAAAEAQVWAVARDLRGGQAVAGPFRVPLER
jgi:hypothetical protein